MNNQTRDGPIMPRSIFTVLLQYERSVVAVKGLVKPQQLVLYHVYNVNKYEYRTGVLFLKTLLSIWIVKS
jgi:hypothetical protein